MLTGVFTRFPADERPPARAVPFVCSDWPVFLTEKSHAPSMVTLWVSFTLGETPVRLGWMKQLCWTHPRGRRVPDVRVPVCWAFRVCSHLVPKERGRLVQRATRPSPPSPLQPLHSSGTRVSETPPGAKLPPVAWASRPSPTRLAAALLPEAEAAAWPRGALEPQQGGQAGPLVPRLLGWWSH